MPLTAYEDKLLTKQQHLKQKLNVTIFSLLELNSFGALPGTVFGLFYHFKFTILVHYSTCW
jgi:hypothetical protein